MRLGHSSVVLPLYEAAEDISELGRAKCPIDFVAICQHVRSICYPATQASVAILHYRIQVSTIALVDYDNVHRKRTRSSIGF